MFNRTFRVTDDAYAEDLPPKKKKKRRRVSHGNAAYLYFSRLHFSRALPHSSSVLPPSSKRNARRSMMRILIKGTGLVTDSLVRDNNFP